MLDEIRSFFDGVRKPFAWSPNDLSALDPSLVRELRATSEKHWHLAMEAADELEAKLMEIYDLGGDEPAAIGVLDRIMLIIRQKKSQDDRMLEIRNLLLSLQRG